jgi:hypothetical protein
VTCGGNQALRFFIVWKIIQYARYTQIIDHHICSFVFKFYEERGSNETYPRDKNKQEATILTKAMATMARNNQDRASAGRSVGLH